MAWFWFALCAASFWALNNVIDQYLAKIHFHGSGPSLIVLSGLVNIPVAGLFFVLNPEVFDVSVLQALAYSGLGALYIACFIPYVTALQGDEAGVSVSIFQLGPVLVLVFGWLILGETVTPWQALAGLAVIVGALGMSLNVKTGVFGWRTVWLMAITTVCLVFYTLGLRAATQTEEWLTVWVWQGAGFVFFGLAGLFISSWRKGLFEVVSKNRKGVLGLSVLIEFSDAAGTACHTLALSLAPAAALVSAVETFQVALVFIYSWIGALIIPACFDRVSVDRLLVWRVSCLLLMAVGIAFLPAD